MLPISTNSSSDNNNNHLYQPFRKSKTQSSSDLSPNKSQSFCYSSLVLPSSVHRRSCLIISILCLQFFLLLFSHYTPFSFSNSRPADISATTDIIIDPVVVSSDPPPQQPAQPTTVSSDPPPQQIAVSSDSPPRQPDIFLSHPPPQQTNTFSSYPPPQQQSSSVTSGTPPLPISVTPKETNITKIIQSDSECPFGKFFVYDLPPMFNKKIYENCDKLNPWGSRCAALSNNGFGRPAKALEAILPNELAQSWYWTDQFASEIIYHNRLLNHKCRTMEAEAASAFYMPFYAGLAVGKYLWSNYSPKDRDIHCEMVLEWLKHQPYFLKSDGWDHFLVMGRITWDFRRSKRNNNDWGSKCIYLPEMRNISRLLIERNPWDYFDIGVPYPTGFHPNNLQELTQWQEFIRSYKRRTLYCFAGSTRGFIQNDFRGLLLNNCRNESDVCRVVDCAGSKCSNGTSEILETFLSSDFCLQPRGDSFTRRSIFDCMVAGSIPVFFWKRTAYYQYEWFLPDEPESYSVFIHRDEVKNGTTSIRKVLESVGQDKIRMMREKIIEYLPRMVYVKPFEGVKGLKDAVDIAVDGVMNRALKHKDVGFRWR